MHKKIAAIIALIILSCIAAFPVVRAEQMYAITEIRTQASEGWKNTYDALGRTILVNIPIIVPQIESLPIIICEDWKQFDESWINDNFPDPIEIGREEAYTGIEYSYPVKAESEWKENRISIQISNNVSIAMSVNDISVRMSKLHSKDHFERKHVCFYPYELDVQKSYAENNPLTIEDATVFLSGLLNRLYGEEVAFKIHWIDTLSRGRITKRTEDQGEGAIAEYFPSGTYVLECDQVLHGLPILQNIWGLLNSNDPMIIRERLRRVECNRLGSSITDYDSWTFGASLKKEKEVVISDIPLIGIHEIVNQIEKMIDSGNIRDVYSLELGYCMFLDPQTDGQYWLYPVWECECSYFENPAEELDLSSPVYTEYTAAEAYRNRADFNTLVFNAQTGERILKEVGAVEEDYYCPPIIE